MKHEAIRESSSACLEVALKKKKKKLSPLFVYLNFFKELLDVCPQFGTWYYLRQMDNVTVYLRKENSDICSRALSM